MAQLEKLKSYLKKGVIYKRDELEKFSKSIDRHLSELTGDGTLKKVGPGLYHFPKKNAFGFEPPADELLINKFLDDSSFLITSFNALGLGTTQLYNKQIVYNHLRSGDIRLGNKLFIFRKRSSFPGKLTKEFLVVDLINNLDSLAEDQPSVLEKALKKAKSLDQPSLEFAVGKYGTRRTRKLLAKD